MRNRPTLVITKPELTAAGLIEKLADLELNICHFPTIAVEPLSWQLPALSDKAALAIFVSQYAVQQAFAQIPPDFRRYLLSLPIYAIGPGTADRLKEQGVVNPLLPALFSSEGLLALPALQAVTGKQVIIFAGEGGRNLLAETLTARGAKLITVSVYRRQLPNPAPVWDVGTADAFVITSGDSLQNLLSLLGDSRLAELNAATLIVASQRIADKAVALGLTSTIKIANDASNDAMVAAIADWSRERQKDDSYGKSRNS